MGEVKPEVRSKEELLRSLQSGNREQRQAALKYLEGHKEPELYIFLIKEADKFTTLEIASLIKPQQEKNLALRVIGALTTDDHTVIPTIAYATDPSQSPEVARALMDHPSRSGAHILAPKISPQTSPQLAREYLYANETWVARKIAENIDPSESPEFASEMMNHPDPEVRLCAVQKLDASTDMELIKRGLGVGNYENVRRESAAKVPVADPLYRKVKEMFPVTADWRRRMEESGAFGL